MLPTWFPALVALHIIFTVTFFAGAFYLLRLFIFHRQALARWEPDRGILSKQYVLMERQLLYLVAWPSLLLVIGTGAWMVWLQPGTLTAPWMQAKLGASSLLFAYHLLNQRIYGKLRRGEKVWPVFALRLWTQCAVLLLVIIVFLSTFKDVQWYIGVLGLLVLGLLLFTAIKAFGSNEPGAKDAQEGKPGA